MPLHSAKTTVLCELVIGTHFFEDPETGSPLTITKKTYTEILMEKFPENSEYHNSRTLFIPDRTPAHNSRMPMVRFPGRLISNKADFMLPPRIPDLNTFDYILWGFTNKKIHRAEPGSTVELKRLIRKFLSFDLWRSIAAGD